jgi:hypothetical protein
MSELDGMWRGRLVSAASVPHVERDREPGERAEEISRYQGDSQSSTSKPCFTFSGRALLSAP